MDPNSPASDRVEKVKLVKAALDKALSGPKRASALKLYQAAQEAQKARNEIERDTAKRSLT